jgi:hypothetical protein
MWSEYATAIRMKELPEIDALGLLIDVFFFSPPLFSSHYK